ncbi:hypothetical protein F5Y14DRAFT_306268 [Nemania sp. NC0429]|nr:hypothetical protein F5Y14DRAFT_306268 [Nemania sp. NC0429]
MSQKITAKNLTYDNSLPPFLARLRGQQQAARGGGPDPILAAQRRPGQKRSASEEAEDAPVVVDEHGNVVDLDDGQLEGEGEGEGHSSRQEPSAINNNNDEDEEGEGEERDAAQRRDGEKEKVASIGASRKRKVGRVIGEEQPDDNRTERTRRKKNNNDGDDDDARIAKASADVRRLLREGEDASTRPRDHDNGRRPARKQQDAKSARDRKPSPSPLPQLKQQQEEKDGPRQKTIKSTKKKAAKKIKLSFGDDDGE